MRASAGIAPSQRRLQRPPDFTGGRLERFDQVFVRHGLAGAVLGAACLWVPELRALLDETLTSLRLAPGRYLLAGLLLLGLMLCNAWRIDRRVEAATVGWVLYLLALASWEEWLFRLVVPATLTDSGLPPGAAVMIANAAFGALHYFTLRWKWQWCLAAFVGGLALSRHLHEHADLAHIVLLHWVATYANTPRPPGSARRELESGT
ncbi:MAG: CPBP family glutamic-type intramembrane protease [Pseudomonadales bacterium]|nr:CPBP family glutamic-type intramembrane protease [Pseudomonadales bacterium]